MLTKAKVKEAIDKFPEEFIVDELIDRLVLIDKIERGNEQSEKGETISEQNLDIEMAKWFK